MHGCSAYLNTGTASMDVCMYPASQNRWVYFYFQLDHKVNSSTSLRPYLLTTYIPYVVVELIPKLVLMSSL